MTEAKHPCSGAVLKSIVSLKLEFLSHNKTTWKQRKGQENQARPRPSLPRKANGLPQAAHWASGMLAHQRFSIQKKSPASLPTYCGKQSINTSLSTSANSLGKFLRSSICIWVFVPSILSIHFSSWFPLWTCPIVRIISHTTLAPSFFLKIANKKIRCAEYYY